MSKKITVTQQVIRQAQYFPENPAFIYGERTYTYQDFLAEVRNMAKVFQQQGVQAGDRVAYLGFNSLTFMTSMVAAWWLGAVYEPFNFRLSPHEVSDLLERSEPKVLVVEPSKKQVIDHLPHLDVTLEKTSLIIVDNDDQVPATEDILEPYVGLTTLLEGAVTGDLPDPYPCTEEDLALLMFTSGTTGLPKGVQLSHGNLWWNSVNVDALVDTRRGDNNLAVAPLFHIGALNALTLRVLARGGCTLIRRTFDPRQVLRDIQDYQIHQAFLVPAMLSAMQQTDEFQQCDISSLRALICAGAPVPPSLLEQYKVKNISVQQAWGLTETAPFATYLPAEMTFSKAGSCGIPMPYTEVKVMDAMGEEITNAGEAGEFWVKGPNVTSGYWNNEDATASAFEEGWFKTGDIGYKDEEGFFYIVDRLKDMIITGGENVYPAEVERVLSGHPDIHDVAVVGVADQQWGEIVVAVITCDSAKKPTTEEIREYCEPYLARYKLPKQVVVLSELFRNGSGKLLKGDIRDAVIKELQK